ncbi:hypothetical protein [Roseicella aquatilis]|uniref:Uncharacterized protein n=1 Tax=Roseicella aquatilis TaxID=2527868 RepID=A0A4R4DV57_9PROT|nr:hypothetical protein [Roseicella aquatilis]TCZ64320.1 hypothetical protein EXY23_06630 [Roseicella aquatilis]
MTEPWQYQIRLYLGDDLAALARETPDSPALRPLAEILRRHDAAMLSQLDAFEAYVAEAEREGPEGYPLHRWTRATLEDPERRRKHARAFALRIGGAEVYPRDRADALEAALRPLVGGLIERLSRHDTNPAGNLPVPEEYRG